MADLITQNLQASIQAGVAFRVAAAKQWCSEELEIDDAAEVSKSRDGAWVRAWVWVTNQEAGLAEDVAM